MKATVSRRILTHPPACAPSSTLSSGGQEPHGPRAWFDWRTRTAAVHSRGPTPTTWVLRRSMLAALGSANACRTAIAGRPPYRCRHAPWARHGRRRSAPDRDRRPEQRRDEKARCCDCRADGTTELRLGAPILGAAQWAVHSELEVRRRVTRRRKNPPKPKQLEAAETHRVGGKGGAVRRRAGPGAVYGASIRGRVARVAQNPETALRRGALAGRAGKPCGDLIVADPGGPSGRPSCAHSLGPRSVRAGYAVHDPAPMSWWPRE